MSERGVFGVDRGIFEHELLKGEPYTKVQAFLWLVAEAAWKPRRSRVAGVWIELDRAQLAHSLSHMAKTWQWTIKRVRGFLGRLADDGMVSFGSEKGTGQGTAVSVLTICNYDTYQVVGLPKGTGQGTSGAQEGHQPEEGKKESTDSVMRARASELCEQVYDIFGFDRAFIPPNWMGLQHWLEAGLRSGWKPDLVRLAARKVAARKGGTPPRDFRYLGPVIQDEHERATAPVPAARSEQTAMLMPMNGGAREATARDNRQPWQVRQDRRHAAVAELSAGLDAIERASGRGGQGG